MNVTFSEIFKLYYAIRKAKCLTHLPILGLNILRIFAPAQAQPGVLTGQIQSCQPPAAVAGRGDPQRARSLAAGWAESGDYQSLLCWAN